MSQILPHTQLSDVILRDPQVIPLLNRWGINLGVGAMTVGDVCRDHDIDVTLFCTILNTYVDDGYFPVRNLMECDPPKIAHYLSITYQSYLRFQLPNIDRHFDMLQQRSGADNNLAHIRRFFEELKREIVERINFDLQQWFPAVERGENLPEVPDSSDIDDKLSDLRNMLVCHLQGVYDTNLCFAVISAIFSLAKDMLKNNRLRDRILRPISCDNDSRPRAASGSPLSPREIQVLRLVAMGHINKEIAAQLGISFNTVLTHRRNITAKLGIKSVSGLGVYALTRGYIHDHDLV